ncbi:MAG: VOC family protein [Dehalococcoidia bacterium]|nr:VOC family protein [Dehalococcoidia bacterium]
MKGTLNHVEVHVSKPDETIPFYRELLLHLGWQVVSEWPGGLGVSDGNASLWFFPTPEELRAAGFNRDATGMAHIGIRVDSREEVDAFVSDYLQPHGLAPQFETPRAREDFGPTYYQVMFVDPEGLAIEVFTS